MSEHKNCKQCRKDFIVEDEDLKFYDRISPTFAPPASAGAEALRAGGKKYQIPSPTLCPDCRQQRRIVFRNDRNLYKRKVEGSDKEAVSMHSPDAPFTVFNPKKWWSDEWDGISYGREYDFSKSFFDQFNELLKVVPKIAMITKNSEDSEYSMYSSDLKNCYLIFSALSSEDCQYGFQCNWSNDSMDVAYLYDSELCYQAIDSRKCYSSKFIQNCDNCSNVSFSFGCRSCKNCYLCTNLVNKEYCFENEQLIKDEYEKRMAEVKWTYSEVEKTKKILSEKVKKCIHVYSHLFNCEDCTGDYLRECKNCKSCYDLPKSEDAKYIWTGIKLDNCMDCSFAGNDSEFSLECLSLFPGLSCFSCVYAWDSSRLYYSDYCFGCKDCFGCAGLRNKQYCILNKQYTREEYEEKVGKIIEKMMATPLRQGFEGQVEWGEFFPVALSPFGYNISLANEYYPMSKDEALKYGATWQDNDYSQEYTGDFIVPNEDINFYKNNTEEVKRLLDGIIKCEVSGKPFKIMPQELVFYIKNNLPVPRKRFDVRHNERFAMRNPRKLYHRECMCKESGHNHEGKCKVEFETTYAPEHSEKIYCESCYQKSVI